MKIELPFPLPTWNRILAMHHWERKKLRDQIHQMVTCVVAGRGVSQGQLEEYDRMIRPKAKPKRRAASAATKVR